MRSLLGNATFLRLFAGRLVTNAGDSLAAVATMWLVHELGGSPALTGLAGALTLAPNTLQFLFGPLADRARLDRLLVGSQLTQLLVVLAVPVSWALGSLSVWVVMAVGPLTALLNQPVYPAQSAALPRIVADDELTDANSAFAFALQGSDSVLNAVGGVLVAAVGGVAVFLVDAVTFGVAALLFARLGLGRPGGEGTPDGEREDEVVAADGGDTEGGTSYFGDLREGFSFVRGTVLLHMAFVPIVVNFQGGMNLALMPGFADTLGGATAYGTLLSVAAVGMLLGSLVAGPLDSLPYGLLAPVALTSSGLAWVAGVYIPGLLPTAVLFGLAMLPLGVMSVLTSALIQSAVETSMLGRVSALLASSSSLAAPLGAFVGGAVADGVGVVPIFAASALAFFLAAIHHLVVPSLRRLPPVAEARRIETN
ncbi:MFS transporter [Haloarchaeobius baliensis]|uniref:MFS transporter n=1 Tax=Haloarchaeobius baliensis TaxID=1670458 RepID=UPI003F8837B2